MAGKQPLLDKFDTKSSTSIQLPMTNTVRIARQGELEAERFSLNVEEAVD